MSPLNKPPLTNPLVAMAEVDSPVMVVTSVAMQMIAIVSPATQSHRHQIVGDMSVMSQCGRSLKRRRLRMTTYQCLLGQRSRTSWWTAWPPRCWACSAPKHRQATDLCTKPHVYWLIKQSDRSVSHPKQSNNQWEHLGIINVAVNRTFCQSVSQTIETRGLSYQDTFHPTKLDSSSFGLLGCQGCCLLCCGGLLPIGQTVLKGLLWPITAQTGMMLTTQRESHHRILFQNGARRWKIRK